MWDGEWHTLCDTGSPTYFPTYKGIASMFRDIEAYQKRLAAIGLKITGCDLKYPVEIYFEVQRVHDSS